MVGVQTSFVPQQLRCGPKSSAISQSTFSRGGSADRAADANRITEVATTKKARDIGGVLRLRSAAHFFRRREVGGDRLCDLAGRGPFAAALVGGDEADALHRDRV